MNKHQFLGIYFNHNSFNLIPTLTIFWENDNYKIKLSLFNNNFDNFGYCNEIIEFYINSNSNKIIKYLYGFYPGNVFKLIFKIQNNKLLVFFNSEKFELTLPTEINYCWTYNLFKLNTLNNNSKVYIKNIKNKCKYLKLNINNENKDITHGLTTLENGFIIKNLYKNQKLLNIQNLNGKCSISLFNINNKISNDYIINIKKKCYYNPIIKNIFQKTLSINNSIIIKGKNFTKNCKIFLYGIKNNFKVCLINNINDIEVINSNFIIVKFNIDNFIYLKNFNDYFYNTLFEVFVIKNNIFSNTLKNKKIKFEL